MNARISLCTYAFTMLLLTGCGNRDDEPDSTIDTGGQPGEISEPAPGSDVPENPLSSSPGGDTRAIAGLWNARSGVTGSIDERYVLISADGLYTEYDYRQDDLSSDGNCFLVYGPLTLTPEDAAGNTYSLPDGRYFSATVNGDPAVLSISFAEEGPQNWDSEPGISAEDFEGCAAIQE